MAVAAAAVAAVAGRILSDITTAVGGGAGTPRPGVFPIDSTTVNTTYLGEIKKIIAVAAAQAGLLRHRVSGVSKYHWAANPNHD